MYNPITALVKGAVDIWAKSQAPSFYCATLSRQTCKNEPHCYIEGKITMTDMGQNYIAW
jgi:hypothetical protein